MQQFRSRRVCWRTGLVICAIVPAFLIGDLVSAQTGGGKKNKGGRRKGGIPSITASPGQGADQSLTNIPLPIGHEAKGLVLPDFDIDGRLRGKFVAGSARRTDQDHVGFRDLQITTYNEGNQVDLEIQMQTSTFDLTTRILSTQERTTIRRSDFNVVGDSAVFDTNARTSRIIGNVKMVITDQSHLAEKPAP